MRPWFTSDLHFGHANIIKYCNRPYKSVAEMNERLIANLKEVVQPEDTVFHVGDFLFKNSEGGKTGEGLQHNAAYYITQLPGHWVFIKGNHDRNNSLKAIIEKCYVYYGGRRACLVHCPEHADPTVTLNIVGHVHDKWKVRRLHERSVMVNVGVDVWNYRPITWDQILQAEARLLREEATKTTTP